MKEITVISGESNRHLNKKSVHLLLGQTSYEGQHGFRPRYSCESQVVTVCQDIADLLDEGVRTDAIIIDFSKAFHMIGFLRKSRQPE